MAEACDLLVNQEPGLLLLRLEMSHHFEKGFNHIIANLGNEGRPRGSDADEDLPTIIERVDALGVAELLEPIDEARRRGGGVPHLMRNLGHREMLLLRKEPQEAVLRKRDVAPG